MLNSYDKINLLSEILNEFCIGKNNKKIIEVNASNIYNLEMVRHKKTEMLKVIDDYANGAEIEKKFNQSDDKYYKIANNLKVGTWLNFKNISSKSVRAKLSWISPLSHKYLFVNSRGIKITHKSCFELAHEFRIQKIEIIDNTIIFDLALFVISKKLQNSENKMDLKTIKINS